VTSYALITLYCSIELRTQDIWHVTVKEVAIFRQTGDDAWRMRMTVGLMHIYASSFGWGGGE